MSGPGRAVAITSPAMPGIVPASPNWPKASMISSAVQTVPARSSADGIPARVLTASRSSMATNRPDRGRVDHSALAVTWNSTTCPSPMRLRVTSGVPSARAAITRSDRVGSGCAITCAFTVTSGGTSSPKNGLSAAKGASALGSPQLIAPPTVRPPARRRTGRSGSSTVAPRSPEDASRGPAKRNSIPPPSIHSTSAVRSASVTVATSASTITSGLAGSTSPMVPASRSAVGASACSR